MQKFMLASTMVSIVNYQQVEIVLVATIAWHQLIWELDAVTTTIMASQMKTVHEILQTGAR